MYTAKDFMTKKVVTVKETDTLKSAAKVMAKHKISCVVVLDKKKKAMGVLTERDFVRDVLLKEEDYSKPINEFLTSPVNKVDITSDIVVLSRYLVAQHLKRLIVTKDGEMVGILTQTDMMRAAMDLIHDIHNKLLLGEFDNNTYKKRIQKILGIVENLQDKPKGPIGLLKKAFKK